MKVYVLFYGNDLDRSNRDFTGVFASEQLAVNRMNELVKDKPELPWAPAKCNTSLNNVYDANNYYNGGLYCRIECAALEEQ